MFSLLDRLFVKRFCLPVNSDISSYEDGTNNITNCLCGEYNHVSCVLQGKWFIEKG